MYKAHDKNPKRKQRKMSKREIKTTSEKPISLHPLEFNEALKVLLKALPPIKENKENKKPSKKS